MALVVFLTGTFGLLGQEKDPLSGISPIPIGLPWILFIDHAPEEIWPWLTALAPMLNLGVLSVLCRRAAKGS